MRYTGIFGLLTTIIFLIGFGILFLINPQITEELHSLSLANINMIGIKGYRWASIVCYILLGLIHSLFTISFLVSARSVTSVFIGALIILVIGFFWLSLGIIPIKLNGETLSLYAVISDISILILSPFGFIVLGAEIERVLNSNFIKYFTLSLGIILIILLAVGLFSFAIKPNIIANVNILLYFVWFGIIGTIMIKNGSA